METNPQQNPVQQNTQANPSTVPSGINTQKQSFTAKVDNPANEVKETTTHLFNLQCAIRRRPGMTGLPGADPNERIYKLSGAISAASRKNLKGVDNELEKKLLPSIIAVSVNDPKFAVEADNYWGNITCIIPADEPYQRDSEKGKIIKFSLNVTGSRFKEHLEKENDIERKFNIICEGLKNGNIEFVTDDGISDFLLLGFALKNKDVAKDYDLLNSSPKIKFYIYNKTTAIKAQYDRVQLRQKANEFFAVIQDNDSKLNTMLIMMGLDPSSYEDTFDKVIALDEKYNESEASMRKFVSFQDDKDLQMKYLITSAVKRNLLKRPANTDSYYYNDNILIGRSMLEAIAFLSDESVPENLNIKQSIENELKVKK